MENLNIVEIKSFVPAKDYALSKRFYEAIGFDMASDFGDVAYFSQGSCAFLLQNFYEPEHGNNFMMHLLVEDAESWHQHLSKVGHEEFGSRLLSWSSNLGVCANVVCLTLVAFYGESVRT